MKEAFIEKEFNRSSRQIIELAESICDNYAGQGYDLSLRQLYYQFISRDYFSNTEQNYKRLGSIISDARMAGLLDWDMIKDRGRETVTNNHWDSPASILEAVSEQFRIDTWADQQNYVEVMVEKQALEGVLLPVCQRLDIRFTANKGYSSSSALYETGQRLQAACERGQDVHIIYLGDHDPSGIDMTRDIEERLNLLSRCEIAVHRIALNMVKVRTYNPPENPAKISDTRADKYIQQFGASSWELDALEPSLLATLVDDIVATLRDDSIAAEAEAKQEAWRSELRGIADGFNG